MSAEQNKARRKSAEEGRAFLFFMGMVGWVCAWFIKKPRKSAYTLRRVFFRRGGVFGLQNDPHNRLGIAGADMNPAVGKIKPAAITGVEFRVGENLLRLFDNCFSLLGIGFVFVGIGFSLATRWR
jgi:hypothetical protein